MTTVIETERLHLRHYEMSKDLQPLCELFSNPKAMEFYGGLKGLDESRAWIDWNLESYRNNGFGLYAIILRSTNEFIGQCGFILQKDVDGIDEVEIGYALHPRFQGKGYATEAAIACKNYLFNTLKRTNVISLIDPKNEPSIKVAHAVGMHFEKEVQRWDKTIHVYSITSEE